MNMKKIAVGLRVFLMLALVIWARPAAADVASIIQGIGQIGGTIYDGLKTNTNLATLIDVARNTGQLMERFATGNIAATGSLLSGLTTTSDVASANNDARNGQNASMRVNEKNAAPYGVSGAVMAQAGKEYPGFADTQMNAALFGSDATKKLLVDPTKKGGTDQAIKEAFAQGCMDNLWPEDMDNVCKKAMSYLSRPLKIQLASTATGGSFRGAATNPAILDAQERLYADMSNPLIRVIRIWIIFQTLGMQDVNENILDRPGGWISTLPKAAALIRTGMMAQSYFKKYAYKFSYPTSAVGNLPGTESALKKVGASMPKDGYSLTAQDIQRGKCAASQLAANSYPLDKNVDGADASRYGMNAKKDCDDAMRAATAMADQSLDPTQATEKNLTQAIAYMQSPTFIAAMKNVNMPKMVAQRMEEIDEEDRATQEHFVMELRKNNPLFRDQVMLASTGNDGRPLKEVFRQAGVDGKNFLPTIDVAALKALLPVAEKPALGLPVSDYFSMPHLKAMLVSATANWR